MSTLVSPISKELIEELERRFPPRCPRENEPLESIHRYSGKVQLIEFLRASHEEQNIMNLI